MAKAKYSTVLVEEYVKPDNANIAVKVYDKKTLATGEIERITKEYHINPDFKPKEIDDICFEFMVSYCKANKQGKWLKSQLEAKDTVAIFKKVDGVKTNIIERYKEIDRPFVSIRANFVNEFFPKIKKPAPVKKPTMKDKFNTIFDDEE